MSQLKYVKTERLWLKSEPTLGEKWIQARIAQDPSILGLGDVVIRDIERPQPKAGRLDLLLQKPDTSMRYEVEIQLGKVDESHIIRTVEYWDNERKRYPQYDHCGVIIAEEMTARFLNVIGLFKGSIPLIAIQMHALKIGNQIALVFTTVLDELTRGPVDEDEEGQVVTDRAYWEAQGTKETVALADALLKLIHTFDPAYELSYNKFYIGLWKDEHADNFAVFRAKKNNIRLELRLKSSKDIDRELEKSGLDVMDYDDRWHRYRIRLQKTDLVKHKQLLIRLLKRAYEDNA